MQGEMKGAKMTTPEFLLVAPDREDENVVRGIRRFRVVRRPNTGIAARAKNIFVLVPASELPAVSEFVSVANRRHQLRVLLVRDDVRPSSIFQMFERAGLKTMRHTIAYSDSMVPRRVLTAWAQDSQEQLIAKAGVSEDRLFLISCALQKYEIEFDKIPSLRCIPLTDRANFTVDEDGSYIHWPGPDIHLDLDAIRAAIDPEARARAEAVKSMHDSRYGAAIASLRVAKGLKQSQIKGLSERQVRRIEKGGGTTYEALRRLASAHRMDLDEYLRQVAANLSDPALERASA